LYLVGDSNGLGNVFVKLDGAFPATPVPSQPVEIDQAAASTSRAWLALAWVRRCA